MGPSTHLPTESRLLAASVFSFCRKQNPRPLPGCFHPASFLRGERKGDADGQDVQEGKLIPDAASDEAKDWGYRSMTVMGSPRGSSSAVKTYSPLIEPMVVRLAWPAYVASHGAPVNPLESPMA